MLQATPQSKPRLPEAAAESRPARGVMPGFRKEMSILEALELHPQARQVFEQHGMTCCLCMGATS